MLAAFTARMLRVKSLIAFLGAAFSATLPALAEEPAPPPAATETIPAPPPASAPPAVAPPLATSPLAPPVMERRSTAAMVSGIVLTSLGGASVIYVGMAAMSGCSEPDTSTTGPSTGGGNCEHHDNIVRGTLIGGAVAVAIGIPLLIYGAKRVPAESTQGAIPLPKWAGAPSATGWGWTL